jgi:hypothetical protein
MTEHEKKIVLQSIQAYKKMIKYFEVKIEDLNSRIQDKCCFEEPTRHKIKIKRIK